MTLAQLNERLKWSVVLCAAALLAGCSADPNPKNRAWPGIFPGAPTGGAIAEGTNAPVSSGGESISKLHPGDPLTITFADVPPLVMQEQRVRIPEDGIITLPYNVRVKAAGKTTSQLEKDIRDAYVPGLFVNLTAIVRTEERAFFVDGEVKAPGRQVYAGEMTVMRAIGTAGGFTDFANRKKIELRRQNGQKFVVNYQKAIDNPDLDLPVYPNDHIIVKRSLF
jgi:polysaccharide export outer membrane protein